MTHRILIGYKFSNKKYSIFFVTVVCYLRLYKRMKNLNDTYYIKRIREGDTDCFGCLLDRYSRQVFALIVRVTNNKEERFESNALGL